MHRSGIVVLMVTVLALTSGCTRWTTVQRPPTPPPSMMRVKAEGRSAWLILKAPKLEGDSVITWDVVPEDAPRVPASVRDIYTAGRLALRRVDEVQVSSESEENDTAAGVAIAAGVVVVVIGTVALLQYAGKCLVSFGTSC